MSYDDSSMMLRHRSPSRTSPSRSLSATQSFHEERMQEALRTASKVGAEKQSLVLELSELRGLHESRGQQLLAAEKKVVALSAKETELKSRIGALTVELERHFETESTVANLKQELSTKENTIQRLTEQIRELQSENAALRNETADLQERSEFRNRSHAEELLAVSKQSSNSVRQLVSGIELVSSALQEALHGTHGYSVQFQSVLRLASLPYEMPAVLQPLIGSISIVLLRIEEAQSFRSKCEEQQQASQHAQKQHADSLRAALDDNRALSQRLTELELEIAKSSGQLTQKRREVDEVRNEQKVFLECLSQQLSVTPDQGKVETALKELLDTHRRLQHEYKRMETRLEVESEQARRLTSDLLMLRSHEEARRTSSIAIAATLPRQDPNNGLQNERHLALEAELRVLKPKYEEAIAYVQELEAKLRDRAVKWISPPSPSRRGSTASPMDDTNGLLMEWLRCALQVLWNLSQECRSHVAQRKALMASLQAHQATLSSLQHLKFWKFLDCPAIRPSSIFLFRRAAIAIIALNRLKKLKRGEATERIRVGKGSNSFLVSTRSTVGGLVLPPNVTPTCANVGTLLEQVKDSGTFDVVGAGSLASRMGDALRGHIFRGFRFLDCKALGNEIEQRIVKLGSMRLPPAQNSETRRGSQAFPTDSVLTSHRNSYNESQLRIPAHGPSLISPGSARRSSALIPIPARAIISDRSHEEDPRSMLGQSSSDLPALPDEFSNEVLNAIRALDGRVTDALRMHTHVH